MATTASPRRPGGAGYLPTLDGWRTIAIGLVLVQHAAESIGVTDGGFLGRVARQGGLGVQVFFAISGFLITSKLLHELQKAGRISLGDFYKRRVFRIYPASLTYITALVLLKLAGAVYLSSRHVAAAVFCFANYVNDVFPGAWTWYLGHFWSLAVEEHFYFLWPAILAICGFRGAWKVAVGLVVAVVAWRWFAGAELHMATSADFFQRTDICMDGLLWGCLVAMAASSTGGRRLLDKLAHPAIWWTMLAAVAGYKLFNDGGSWTLVADDVLAAVIAVMVAGTVMRPQRLVGRALEWSPVWWVGRISYSLYLWQQLFLASGTWRSARLSALQHFPVSLLMTFVCAAASYYLIERPFLRVGHRFLGRTGDTPAAAPVKVMEG